MIFGLFTKRVNEKCLQSGAGKAAKLLHASLNEGCSIYMIDANEFANQVRSSLECQMMVVSVTASLCNFGLQEAYYDAGLADPISGMPPFKFNPATDGKRMARIAWAGLPPCKADLDMRYRYIFANNLMDEPETEVWAYFQRWTNLQAENHFRWQMPFSSKWVQFISAIKDGDGTKARQLIFEDLA